MTDKNFSHYPLDLYPPSNNYINSNLNYYQNSYHYSNNNSNSLFISPENNNKNTNTQHIPFNNNNNYQYDHKKISERNIDNNKDYGKIYLDNKVNLCGIKNYGNNCYFNSGLQILASCEKFIEELKKYSCNKILTNYIKEAIFILQNEKIYEPIEFLKYFSEINHESFTAQSCSQNFIRNLLKKLNDELLETNENLVVENNQYIVPLYGDEGKKYYDFIYKNNIFPESSLISAFSGISKSHSKQTCKKCFKLIDEYSFSYFFDQNMYLDEIKHSCKFSDVLNKNFEKNIVTMNCRYCHHEITVDEETKIIKLPEILIFTLERYQGEYNDIEIEPDEYIYMNNYLDRSVNVKGTRYELFAINIRFGKTKNYGHEICQVKRKGKWYVFNDVSGYESDQKYNKNSYGLFYKRLMY